MTSLELLGQRKASSPRAINTLAAEDSLYEVNPEWSTSQSKSFAANELNNDLICRKYEYDAREYEDVWFSELAYKEGFNFPLYEDAKQFGSMFLSLIPSYWLFCSGRCVFSASSFSLSTWFQQNHNSRAGESFPRVLPRGCPPRRAQGNAPSSVVILKRLRNRIKFETYLISNSFLYSSSEKFEIFAKNTNIYNNAHTSWSDARDQHKRLLGDHVMQFLRHIVDFLCLIMLATCLKNER